MSQKIIQSVQEIQKTRRPVQGTMREVIRLIQETTPRIHSITNTITINDCANIVLAAGGSAIMASDPEEVSEMTSLCDGLVLNLGAVASREAMLRAGMAANAQGLPIVFDPVAAGATSLRRQTSLRLMQELALAAIRGNATEIHTLSILSGRLGQADSTHLVDDADDREICSFVDADKSQAMRQENWERCREDAMRLSRHTGAIVVVSGIEDLVVQGERCQVFSGGSVFSSRITGSGCMLSELVGVCLAAVRRAARGRLKGAGTMGPAEDALQQADGTRQQADGAGKGILSEWDAVRAAVQWMNEAAECAERKMRDIHGGTMTYRMYLVDEVSRQMVPFHS